jgi:hypothetical protein
LEEGKVLREGSVLNDPDTRAVTDRDDRFAAFSWPACGLKTKEKEDYSTSSAHPDLLDLTWNMLVGPSVSISPVAEIPYAHLREIVYLDIRQYEDMPPFNSWQQLGFCVTGCGFGKKTRRGPPKDLTPSGTT